MDVLTISWKHWTVALLKKMMIMLLQCRAAIKKLK
jgi:hypothetical protein